MTDNTLKIDSFLEALLFCWDQWCVRKTGLAGRRGQAAFSQQSFLFLMSSWVATLLS